MNLDAGIGEPFLLLDIDLGVIIFTTILKSRCLELFDVFLKDVEDWEFVLLHNKQEVHQLVLSLPRVIKLSSELPTDHSKSFVLLE